MFSFDSNYLVSRLIIQINKIPDIVHDKQLIADVMYSLASQDTQVAGPIAGMSWPSVFFLHCGAPIQ